MTHARPLVVQKFGGTSLATPSLIRAATRHAIAARDGGARVVVVVSAMAGETDRLLGLGRELTGGDSRPYHRELDALASTGENVSAALFAMALQVQGAPARSFSAHQLRILTDGRFQRARIRRIDGSELLAAIEAGRVAVVTGFQGIDHDNNVVTLGRGGSDATAVAIAAAFGADTCEIYTDVDGVYTADPAICPDGRKLERLHGEEMLELASLGAKVLQLRAVELAMKHGVEIHVRSTFDSQEGTRIMVGDSADLEAMVVTGVTMDDRQAKVSIAGLKDIPDLMARVLQPLARDEISVDLITHNVARDGSVTVTFSLPAQDLEPARASIERDARRLGASDLMVDADISKVSIVGIGMRTRPGVAQKMFDLLCQSSIPIYMAVSTEIKTSCLVPADRGEEAVRVLHDGFSLS